jgi:hypothetical protein
MIHKPGYFEDIRARAAKRWVQLEQDPELAGPWHQLFKQVQSPRHVVSELLQNADDAGATDATVEIRDGEFVFSHNGEDFTEEHFASLCRFGYSNKRALHTIGFRGIGFKSTFSLGDEVRLVTPTLAVSFARERFTEPVWCGGASGHPSMTSVRVTIKDQHRQQELEKNLNEWLRSPASLLFFHHIRSLRIGDQEVRWESQGHGPIGDSEWMSLSSSPEERHLLIRSPAEEFPAEALEEIRQERMVSRDEESTFPPCRIEIVLGMEGRLFVILPTGVSTDLPFACNAPFVQDPARVKIKDPDISPTNRWLLARAGKLAAEAMLAWLSDERHSVDDRCAAYALMSDVDRNDNSLEGSCATIVETAFDDCIEHERFLLAESGSLEPWGGCTAVPKALLDVWEAEQVSAFFTTDSRRVLTRHISDEDRRKLIHWGCAKELTESDVLDTLKTKHLPRPESWRQLMVLWAFLSDDVGGHRYYQQPHQTCEDRAGPGQGCALRSSMRLCAWERRSFLQVRRGLELPRSAFACPQSKLAADSWQSRGARLKGSDDKSLEAKTVEDAYDVLKRSSDLLRQATSVRSFSRLLTSSSNKTTATSTIAFGLAQLAATLRRDS